MLTESSSSNFSGAERILRSRLRTLFSPTAYIHETTLTCIISIVFIAVVNIIIIIITVSIIIFVIIIVVIMTVMIAVNSVIIVIFIITTIIIARWSFTCFNLLLLV